MLPNEPIDKQRLQALDLAHFMHPFTDHKALRNEKSRIMVRAEGVHVWDIDGKRYLDAMSGLWSAAVGYGRDEIVEAATRQMQKLPFYNAFFKTATEPTIELARKLVEITPPQFNRAFFANSGSEAVETMLRMARHYWQLMGKPAKRVVIGREFGYHGSTTMGAGAGGMVDMHRQGVDTAGFSHMMPPYWYRYGGDTDLAAFGLQAAQALEQRILELGAENVAAFIGEPIQGAGGVIIPPDTYWPEIQRICRAHDILLLADEVICGFGRTGRWFGSDRFEITADMMSLAKAISSGYLPLSAVMVGDRVADLLIEQGGEFYHGFTYSGHAAACAAALANLAIIDRENLVERSARTGTALLARLREALGGHPLVAEIRGCGLIGAIELAADTRARTAFPQEARVGTICRDHCLEQGIIMRAVRDAMVFAPPLTLDEAGVDELVTGAVRAIDATQRDLVAGGLARAA